MDRRIRNPIIVVVVVALAYPAAAWLLGLSVEHQWKEREQYALTLIPYIAVVKHDYRRGVYSSTEEVTYGLGTSAVRSLRAAGQADWPDHVQFTLRNTIHHGPLPRLRTLAPATVDTEIILPAEIRQKLAATLGSEAGLTIHTRMKWFGGSTTTVHSAAFQRDIPDGGALSWRGLDARVELGREIGSQSVKLTAPGLSLKGPAANVSFENLELNSDVHVAFDVLNVGTVRMTLGRVDIEEPGKDFKAAAQDLSLDTRSGANGEYVDTDYSLRTGALQVGKFTTTRSDYELHLGHLNGPATAALIRAIRAAQTEAVVGQTRAEQTGKILEAFKTSGVEILLHDPVLQIPRAGFKTPDGEMLLSLNATLPGVTRADLDVASPLLTFTLLKHLRASVDARIDTALLDQLLDSTGKGDTITAQLQGLQRQGYIKLDGKALTTHLAFQNSQLRVNDLPFPPRPAPEGPTAPGGPALPGGHAAPGMPGTHGQPRIPR